MIINFNNNNSVSFISHIQKLINFNFRIMPGKNTIMQISDNILEHAFKKIKSISIKAAVFKKIINTVFNSFYILGLLISFSACSPSSTNNVEPPASPAKSAVSDVSFNFDTKTVKLNSGYEMPVIGLGTYSLKDDICVNSVSAALKNGYKLIDTAYIYHNEESVGKGIRESGVPREEIFITTKLYMNQYADAENAINEALKKLDVDYIDLILLHHPGAHDIEAYKAMEKAVSEGKIRSIGLSNYYIDELEDFLPQITIMPALIQNEIHPYYQENEVIKYMLEKGIVMEAWYPLGGRGHTAELFNNETIAEIAKVHNKSSAQIILRWHLQKGVVAIPGSSNPEHIKENMNIFDFELTAEDMKKINSLDRNEKHDWY